MNANAANIKQLFGPKSYRQFRETSPWSLMGGDCLRKVITGGGSTVTNQLPSTEMANGYEIEGAFHLPKISRISGSAVNGTRFVGSSHWKIPRKSAKSKKVVPFSRLEFLNGISCSSYVSRSLYQFQVPGFTTKWNNFLPIGNSTFATTEISGFFFVNGKRPW